MEYKNYSGPCGYTQIIFTSDEFHALMTDFKAAAENKKFKYISYTEWRNLWKWPFKMQVEIYGYQDTVELMSLDDTSCPHFWEYHKYDDSLGAFLHKFMENEKARRELMISDNDYLNAVPGSSNNCAEKAISNSNVTNGTTAIDYSPYTISTVNSICYDPIVTESTLTERLSEIENKIQALRENKVEIYDLNIVENDLKNLISTKANCWDVDTIDNDAYRLQQRVEDIYNRMNSYVSEFRCNDSALVDDILKLKNEIEELKNANTIFNEKNTNKSTIQFKNNEYIKTNNKENEKMKNFVNFDFGPCTGDNVRMSMYGLAVKNVSGTWVSYDAAKHAIMDVDVFNFDGAKFLYKMPVAIKDIAAGDVIIHARKPMFVTRVAESSIWAVDPVDGENKEIMLTRSPFGFNFATKVINFMSGMTGGAASSDCPFGNMWMLMMMDGSSDMSDMLLPMMMMNGGANMGNMNPMMMAMLMGDKGDIKDMLPWMFMMNSVPAVAPATAQ